MSVERVPKCVAECQVSNGAVVLQLLSSFHAQNTIKSLFLEWITLRIMHICKEALDVAK